MKRPVGITILAVLYLIGGVAVLGLQLAMAPKLIAGFERSGIPAIQAHVALGFLGMLGVAGGVGMIRGKPWGWWLGAFYLTYSVARSAHALLLLPRIAAQFNASADLLAPHYVKFGGRIVVHSLICWYFFTSGVEEFFAVAGTPRWKRLVLLIAATLGVVLGFTALQHATR